MILNKGVLQFLGILAALASFMPRAVGAQWQAGGMPLCTAPMSQEYPVVMEDGRGGVFVAWIDKRDSAATRYDIYIQRLNAAGVPQWMAQGLPVCTFPGNQLNPHLASDGGDGVIIAWQDARSGTHFDIYAQRVGASGTMGWAAGGVLLRNTDTNQFLNDPAWPAIVPDGSGGAIVAWDQTVTGTNSEIYAQRVDADGALLWGDYAVPVCTAASFQQYVTLIADGSGGAIMSWNDWRFWPVPHIYAQRLNSLGEAQWVANGLRISTSDSDQRDSALLSDGCGGTIIAYTEYRGGYDGNIHVQRLNAGGEVQWADSGVALCTVYGGQYRPAIATDGAGGAIVAWTDLRGNPSCVGGCVYDVYAQRVSGGGMPLWAPDGVGVCTDPREQAYPVVVADGAGGVILVWPDARSGKSEIYAQHVDASGSPHWTLDGVPLAGGFQTRQDAPIVASDGAGGAIIVWGDNRNGSLCNPRWGCTNTDIYAARVTGGGLIDVPDASPPARGRLTLQPNPMHAATTLIFDLPRPQAATVTIFDLAGHRVRRLAWSQSYPAGSHRLIWNGRNDAGHEVASGLYLLQLSSEDHSESRRIIVLK